jgi:hypothetical protein
VYDRKQSGSIGSGSVGGNQVFGAPGKQTLTEQLAVQCRAGQPSSPDVIHEAAHRGLASPTTSLPHADTLQRAFGPVHDVSGIQAHVGGAASAACQDMNASAFASGNHVAFAGSPDLHTAAHEVAHVVQQAHGVNLYGGVGAAGDHYERHADAVADRVVAGRSISDLFGARSPAASAGAGSYVQRDETPKTGASDPKGAQGGATAAPGTKTTPITLTALYSDVPGAAKDVVKKATDGNALWFDPLTLHSNVPAAAKNSRTTGVSPGAETNIGSFQAPVTDGPDSHGIGSITAELKYASSLTKSFDVQVTGLSAAKKPQAEKAARTAIEASIQDTGDIRSIESDVQRGLQDQFPGAVVHISVRDEKTQDAGHTTVFYRAVSNPLIQLNVKVAPVGEKVVQSGGTTTTGDSTSSGNTTYNDKAKDEQKVTDSQKSSQNSKSGSKETVDIERNKQIVDTLEDKIKRVDEMRSKFIGELADHVVKDDKFDANRDEKSWVHDDGSYDVKTKTTGSKEEGDKTKDNWAATGQKIIGIGKDVVSIPGIDNIPGVGKVTRFLKGWELDLADKVLGLFAESGKVHYVDTKEEGSGNSTWKDNVDAGSKGSLTVKGNSTADRKAKLEQTMTKQGESNWSEFKKSVRTEEEKYKSVTTKDASSNADQSYDQNYGNTKTKEASGGTTSAQQSKSKTVTTTFQTSTTWKYTTPVVTATVVSGNGEVSDQTFTESGAGGADAAKAKTTDKQ